MFWHDEYTRPCCRSRDFRGVTKGSVHAPPRRVARPLGPENRPYHLAVLATSRGSIKVRLRLSSAEDAKALHSWLPDALVRAKEDGLSALDAIKPILHESEVTVEMAAAMPLAMDLRAAVVEAFNFPTASMAPTVLMGDRVFVANGAFATRNALSSS